MKITLLWHFLLGFHVPSFLTFSARLSCSLLPLAYLKPNMFVAYSSILCFINPCRILACVITERCSKCNLIMLLTYSLIVQTRLKFLISSPAIESISSSKQDPSLINPLQLPITLEDVCQETWSSDN